MKKHKKIGANNMCNDRGRSNNGIWQLNNTKMVRILIKAKSRGGHPNSKAAKQHKNGKNFDQGKKSGRPSQFKGDRERCSLTQGECL
jgi:hypothetical protein